MKYPAYILLAVCCFLPGLSCAAEADNDWLPKARETIAAIEHQLGRSGDTQEASRSTLSGWSDALAAISNRAGKCVHDATDTLDKLKRNLADLNTASEPNNVTVSETRKELARRIDDVGTRLGSCQALLLKAGSLTDRIDAAQTEQLTSYLFAHSKPVWTALAQALGTPLDWHRNLTGFLDEHLRIHTLGVRRWLAAVVAAAIGWLLGWRLSRFLRRCARSLRGETTTYGFATALCACLAQRVQPILTLLGGGLALAVVMQVHAESVPLAVVLIGCVVLYLTASMATRILLDPCPPAAPYLKLDTAFSVSLNRHLRSLWLMGFLVVFLSISGVYAAFDADQQTIIRATVVAVVIVNLIWLGVVMSRTSGVRVKTVIRAIAILILAAALVAEFLGYDNLSTYLIKALVGSLFLGVGLWFGHILIQEFFDGMEKGQHLWQKRLRVSLGLKGAESIPGMIWLRILAVLVLWVFFAAGILKLWGYSDSSWLWVQGILSNGFEVGAVDIVPLQLATGLMIFALFLTGMRWFNREVLPSWVGRTRLDRGGREAVVTLTGYVGIIVAALVGLTLAGFSLKNLAIVAGALSVGIGFGLQNIVNNFVSGIILLFERPIRTGDWIVAGEVQGFVRKISIRSTLIETFDRADVIVPNSALISDNVTNWMLRDPWGRVTVPVGVAYGSDVDKVTEVLMSAAQEHPLVMVDGKNVSPPQVLFSGFGDSSLNFELRCFIREIDKRLVTLSDLNYAIERKLREAAIEIPFPQRDLHVRSVDPAVGWPGGVDRRQSHGNNNNP
ncbi:MAG: mechanosensitive ion channel domain-containing protein [Thiogranum sp.]